MSLLGAARLIHQHRRRPVLGLAASVLALTALAIVLDGRVHVASVGPDTPGTADSRVLRDSLGVCRATLPSGWRPARGGVIRADGPEGSSAEILLGVGTGSWKDDKAVVRRLFAEAAVSVLEDDTDALILAIEPAGRLGYSVVAVRPGKAGYCWVRMHAGSLRVPARLLADFAAIGASVEALP